MEHQFIPWKWGMVFGVFGALWHVVWSFMVFIGVGQWILDMVFWLHFLNNPIVVAPFGWKRAAGLVVTVFVLWFLLGWVFAVVWNMVHRRRVV